MSLVRVDRYPPVATVALARVDRFNALSNGLRDALEQEFNALANDSEIGAVILTADGPHFSVGYDLAEVIATKLGSFQHRVIEYHLALYEFPKPLVGAYRGFALAGGFDLALAADYIVSSERAVYGHPEIKFGAPPLVTSLARKIGPMRALELIWKGDQLTAKKALAAGFINEIVKDEDIITRANKIAQRFARVDRESAKLTKRFSNELFLGSVRENLKREFQAFANETDASSLLARVSEYYDGLRLKQGPA